MFQFNTFIKAPPKTLSFVYDYAKGDFEGLRTALSAINLSSIIANDDINTDWHQWKGTFLVAVSDYIQTKRLKGRNPIPWMSGVILNLIKKKESQRQKLKLSPSIHLKEELKNLRKTVRRMLWNSLDEFLGSVESDLNTNPKRFLSILKMNSKSHTIPDRVSTPMSASASTDPGDRTPLRSSAENPREIANLFISYFASVFAHDTTSPFIWKRCQCTSFSYDVGINAHG